MHRSLAGAQSKKRPRPVVTVVVPDTDEETEGISSSPSCASTLLSFLEKICQRTKQFKPPNHVVHQISGT